MPTPFSSAHCVVKNLPANAEDITDTGSIPGLGRSPGGGHGNPLQYSCLENPMDRGAWWATVHRVAKSQTQVKWLSTHAPTVIKFFSHSDQQPWGWSRKTFMRLLPLSPLLPSHYPALLYLTFLMSEHISTHLLWTFTLDVSSAWFALSLTPHPVNPKLSNYMSSLQNCPLSLVMGLLHFLPISFLVKF